jgi:O-antigen ligase
MNRALEIVLVVVVAGMVLDFGGVQPLAYSLMEIVLFATLLALLIHQTWRGRLQLGVSIWPVLFAVWVALQMIPLPASLVRALQPVRFHEPLTTSADARWLTLSVYPHATLLLWMRFLGYLTAFILAVHLFDSRKRRSILVGTLIGMGLFESIYGSAEYVSGSERIFAYTKRDYRGMATGTYINHNHYAGLLELTLPFLVGLALYYFQIWQQNRGKRFSRDRQKGAAGFQAVAYAFLVIAIMVGLIFSRSRGGILGALFSLVFITLLGQLRARRKTWLLGVFVFLAVAAGYGLWIGLGPVLTRFEQLGLGTQEFDVATRLSFSTDAMNLIRDYPWTGMGLGTFAIGFRHYQTAWTIFFVDHVHNDYLEFAAETGVIGVALLFLPILYLLIRMIIRFLKDARRYRPSILLGCIGSVLAILIHSTMDFNLQIPANALVLAVVLGIGYKAACVERAGEEVERPVRESVHVSSVRV